MRIWDLAPGYLSRQSLLGEHRELHGLHSILVHRKTGYSRHPETRRWVGCIPSLVRRHEFLAAEMRLRGYSDRTPLSPGRIARVRWPTSFVTAPVDQFLLIGVKYSGQIAGRIALPRSVHELWAQHKYSMLARDPSRYREIGRRVARLRGRAGFTELAEELVLALREMPRPGHLATGVEHMWGYVSRLAEPAERRDALRSPAALLRLTQNLAMRHSEPYLLASTALSELAVFVTGDHPSGR